MIITSALSNSGIVDIRVFAVFIAISYAVDIFTPSFAFNQISTSTKLLSDLVNTLLVFNSLTFSANLRILEVSHVVLLSSIITSNFSLSLIVLVTINFNLYDRNFFLYKKK